MRGHPETPYYLGRINRENQLNHNGVYASFTRKIRSCRETWKAIPTSIRLCAVWMFVMYIVFGGLYYELQNELNQMKREQHQQMLVIAALHQMMRSEMIRNNLPSEVSEQSATKKSLFNINDDINVAVHENDMDPMERIRLLELKVDSVNNWAKDPFFGFKQTSECHKITDLVEFRPEEERNDDYDIGLWQQSMCLDHFSSPVTDGKECLIYDFGIREQPEFGQILAQHFQCEVHAFDPSPVSVDWYNGLDEYHPLKTMDNYHFHDYGIGGQDGTVNLYEYNWGQVSTVRYPDYIFDCGKLGDKEQTHCEKIRVEQKSFPMEVKTMKTIRKELGHEDRDIDVVKIDAEGSEYGFLYSMFDDYVCPDFIKQITLEWHHFPIDPRFGEGSSPHINQLSTLLHACGLESFWTIISQGYRSWDKIFDDLKMRDIRYNLQGFHRRA